MTRDGATGKFLYDTVSARLADQAADQAALTGRAKDLLGVAVISSTITGVLANDKLSNVTKRNVPAWLCIVMAIALLVVVTTSFVALCPRTWYLSPDPDQVFKTVTEQPDWTVDIYYASVARGFIVAKVVRERTALDHNREQLEFLRKAVLVEIAGLAVLSLAGMGLAWNAWR